MSGKSTGYRHVRREGQQETRLPVLSHAGIEKYATGCGKLPSKHLDRQIKTQINQKNCKVKTVIRTNKFSIGTINVQTAKEELKLAEYALHVMNNKNDICLFQETHRTGDKEIQFDGTVLKGWKIISSGFKKKAQAGVAIVLAPHVKLEDVIYVKAGRIVGVRVIVSGIKLSIFSCYSPTDTKSYSEQTKDEFYSSLLKATKSVKSDHPSFKLIVGGDFNATIGKDCEPDQWECVGKTMIQILQVKWFAIAQFMQRTRPVCHELYFWL